MAKEQIQNNLWIPINMWDLNEVFTTESISPISFYCLRNFGNPLNRNEGKYDDANYLALFDHRNDSEISIEVSKKLLDRGALINTKLGYSEYYKTIYFRKGLFKVHFKNAELLQEFISRQMMLLEVKAVNKFKTESIVVSEYKISAPRNFNYQHKVLTQKWGMEPFFDKALNQIKGLIYGYVIGSIKSLGEPEQSVISDLNNLKNKIGGYRTDIALSDDYTNLWLDNLNDQIIKFSENYFDLIKVKPPFISSLVLRLKEVDKLNKMRFEEVEFKRSPTFIKEYTKLQNKIDNSRMELYRYEELHDIINLKAELNSIKEEEKSRGAATGKLREYFKKGSEKYIRKCQLKLLIDKFEKNDFTYIEMINNVKSLEALFKKFESDGTQFETSIDDQFSRITEQLNEFIKRTQEVFQSQNNLGKDAIDIEFDFDLKTMSNYYFSQKKSLNKFLLKLPESLECKLSENELDLIKLAINAILSYPQGRLGSFSEADFLSIIKEIGQNMIESDEKKSLRDYYLYRTANSEDYKFPMNDVLANIIVFFMKVNGHDQINKMLISKSINHQQLAFMLYGAYTGFANLPKTFTKQIFENECSTLQVQIDNYIFSRFIINAS